MAEDRNTVVLETICNDILDLKKRVMALEEANGELRRKIDILTMNSRMKEINIPFN